MKDYELEQPKHKRTVGTTEIAYGEQIRRNLVRDDASSMKQESRGFSHVRFKICYYNLMEKHLRGQKDFSDEIWDKIVKLKEKLYEKEI